MHNAHLKIQNFQFLMTISATDCVGKEFVCEKMLERAKSPNDF